MCTVLLIGPNPALLEGLAQTLASAGHYALITAELGEARDVARAAETAGSERPLVAVIERSLASNAGFEVLRLPLAPGGSLVLYRTDAEPRHSLSAAVER